MNKARLLLVLCLLSITPAIRIIAQTDSDLVQIVQWASAAQATSQYTDTAWSAERATGEPDVFICADDGNAWASLETSSSEELTLYFDQTVQPTQINIFQTYTPGAITRVDIIPADGSRAIPIRGSADPGTACPGVFSLDLPGGLPESNGVIIHLDQSRTGNWNEIDAVELVGLAPGTRRDAMRSSLEAGTYPEYTVTSSGSGPGAGRDSNTTQQTAPTQIPPSRNYAGEWGVALVCNDGTRLDNGIEVTVIQQRSGSQYRVSAVGLNGFDPVMAIVDQAGNALCNDDDSAATNYSANLPTTGQVPTSDVASQIIFNNVSSSTFEDIRIVVGGYGGMGGEFLLIVEGMVSSSADGAGDPFSLYVSPALVESGVTPTAYMIAVTGSFDPLLYLIDADYNTLTDTDGVEIVCDDAGNSRLCWGESYDLSRSYVMRSNGRQLPGGPLDAMLSIPVGSDWGYYINYTMSNNNSYGDYVAVFHLGTAQE